MIHEYLKWWKEVKWYWKVPAAFVLILAIIGIILSWVFLRCPKGMITREQVREIDTMHRNATDERIADAEQEIAESKQRTEELDAQAIAHRKERHRIEREADEIAKSLASESGRSIAELNEWRRKNGV